MKKTSVPALFSNAFCPQTLFLYGTYKEDGTPNFGLFCWATYCADEEGMNFVACIGEDKLTRDRIQETGVLSAALVTQEMLPSADFCGFHSGRNTDKSLIVPSERGQALNVPVPLQSPWVFELEVKKTLHVDDRISHIYICRARNIQADERLLDEKTPLMERVRLVSPIVTMDFHYLPVEPRLLGAWGDWKER